jgi:hypothetical protein
MRICSAICAASLVGSSMLSSSAIASFDLPVRAHASATIAAASGRCALRDGLSRLIVSAGLARVLRAAHAEQQLGLQQRHVVLHRRRVGLEVDGAQQLQRRLGIVLRHQLRAREHLHRRPGVLALGERGQRVAAPGLRAHRALAAGAPGRAACAPSGTPTAAGRRRWRSARSR